ncbi:hypothetical protein [Nocardia sp. NPDC050406]|uniref:hypothetical protein n=1 Tax=Nocardia sp. NPDC050406 TaxID=3364318 RepID=UPI0037B15648
MRLASLTMLAMVVALTACGNSSDSSKATTSTAASSTTVTSTSTQPTGTSAVPPPAPRPTPHPTGDVNCGPVTGANGQSADVIAYSSQAGIPGCTEAITVASHYVQATRTGDATAVDGWTCEPQPDNAVAHICFKDGLLIGLRGAAAPVPPPPPPPPTTTPVPEPIENVDCGTVTDAGGGTRGVTAVGTPAGRVGCTEAIDVATEYVQTISDSDTMDVSGWHCMPSACTKDGLTIALGG